MKEIANLQSNMLIVYDKNNSIIFVNTAFLNFFNVKNVNEFSKKIGHLKNCFIKKNNVFFYHHLMTNHWTQEIELLDEDKRLVSMCSHNIPFLASENLSPPQETFLVNIKYLAINNHKICTFSEITGITSQKNEFEIKAFIDELTQIPNRAKFNQEINKELVRYHRYKQALSLIIFDIDYFKHFNDSYGHQAGDDILCELASLIQKRMRNTDLLARWGGEEFVIILPNTELISANSYAEELRLSIEKHVFKDNLNLTCSFGLATAKQKDDEQSFLKRADNALYQAKRNGRNQVVAFD